MLCILSDFVPFIRDDTLWFQEECEWFETAMTGLTAITTVLSDWERIHLALVPSQSEKYNNCEEQCFWFGAFTAS